MVLDFNEEFAVTPGTSVDWRPRNLVREHWEVGHDRFDGWGEDRPPPSMKSMLKAEVDPTVP